MMTDRYESRATTHAADCWSWGPAHYECAVREIKALLDERDALREALETVVEMIETNGFGKAYAMTIARAALAISDGGAE